MYKDKHRIEDALLPFLFRDAALAHISQDEEVAKYYEKAIKILDDTEARCFEGLSKIERTKLRRRLIRVVSKIVDYFVDNKFTTRKMFLCLSEWNRALLDANAYMIPDDSSFFEFINDLHEIILNHGYGEIDNFAKIDESAINHVPKIHKLVQAEGYYI